MKKFHNKYYNNNEHYFAKPLLPLILNVNLDKQWSKCINNEQIILQTPICYLIQLLIKLAFHIVS